MEGVQFRKDVLDNKGVQFDIIWYITLDALNQWNTDNKVNNLAEFRHFASHDSTVKKIETFLGIMKDFISKSDGYPSSTIKTKQAICVFCSSNGAIEAQINFGNDLSFFYLFLDIIGIKTHKLSMEYTIKHELYHGVSKAKEKEFELQKLMVKYSDAEEHILRKHFSDIQSGIEKLKKYVETGGAGWKTVVDAIELLQKEDSGLNYLIKTENGTVQLLLNMIADSILTVLAMENKDDKYVEEAVAGDEHNLANLASHIEYINRTREVIETLESQQTGNIRLFFETNKITLILIEILLFFRYLPIKGISLLAVGPAFRNNQKNLFYKGSLYMRAKKNNEVYLSYANKCAEYSFIRLMLDSYLACITNNEPSLNAPFAELHQNFREYEELGFKLKQKLSGYLEKLENNIGVLKSNKM